MRWVVMASLVALTGCSTTTPEPHRCRTNEYLGFTVYFEWTGTEPSSHFDPTACATQCSSRTFPCATTELATARELPDGCLVSATFIGRFDPPVEVSGTCYPDPSGTYVGAAGQVVVAGTPYRPELTGALQHTDAAGSDAYSFHWGAGYSGSFVGNELQMNAPYGRYHQESVQATLDPGAGVLTGELLLVDCAFPAMFDCQRVERRFPFSLARLPSGP